MEKPTSKRSIQGKKLQSQQRIVDQPPSSLPTTPISSYLTTDCISPRSTSSINCMKMQIKQVEKKKKKKIYSRSLHLV